VNGRKRHIAVDTLGLLLAVVVHPANFQDRDGLWLLLARLRHRFARLKSLIADGGYAGRMQRIVPRVFGWTLQIVKRSDRARGFEVLPKRWIVERSLAWFGRNRRLSKDYEERPESSEAMIYLSSIQLMVRRLRPP
jgi:putative transposase